MRIKRKNCARRHYYRHRQPVFALTRTQKRTHLSFHYVCAAAFQFYSNSISFASIIRRLAEIITVNNTIVHVQRHTTAYSHIGRSTEAEVISGFNLIVFFF